MNLKSIFPRGSNAFFQANHQIVDNLQSTESQQDASLSLGGAIPGKETSLGRVTISFRGYFVRLKDPDNFAASIKHLLDGVRRCGLVDDDSPDKIKLVCEQEKVAHFGSERIEVKITYPKT